MKNIYAAVGLIFLANAFQITVALADGKSSPDSVTYESPTGVQIEMKADGSEWIRIRSVGEADLVIGDRRDVMDATKKATLHAKADIAKWLQESVATTETAEELTKTLTEHNGQSQNVNRKTVDTLTTNIHNSATQILKGVVAVEQKVDTGKKLVKVTVGISKNTMRAADSVRNAIKNDLSSTSPSSGATSGSSQSVGDEIRRSKNYDNF